MGIICDVNNILLMLILLRSCDANDLDLSSTFKLLLRLINEFVNIYFLPDDAHTVCYVRDVQIAYIYQ